MKKIALLTILIAVHGCNRGQLPDTSSKSTDQANPAIEQDDEVAHSRPESSLYLVVDLDMKNTPTVQHRYPRVVLPNPDSKIQVENALKEIYSWYKRDIEETQPDAKYKRISILLYDCKEEAEDYDGCQICLATSSSFAGPTLPDWEDVNIEWKWRNPQYRPTEQQREIFRDYWRGLKLAAQIAEAPFYNSKGYFIGTSQDQPTIDRRKKTEEIKLVKLLCNRYGMSQSEMEQLIAYVWIWRSGDDPTYDRVENMANFFHEEWKQ